MTKLSAENIQFIDNYLENSNVIYADIRMEMTDHVASEIENITDTNKKEPFYHVFKTYMVENKASLLSENKKFIKSVVNQNMKLILKELIAIKTILLFVSLLFSTNYFLGDLNAKSLKYIFAIPLFSMFPLALAYFIGSKKFNFSRFSGVERLGFMYTVLFQLIHFISIIIRPKIEQGINIIYILLGFTSSIILIYVFVKVSIDIIKSYMLKYKSIA